MTVAVDELVELDCFHCGTPLNNAGVEHDGKPFCCAGCKAVYQILSQNRLCTYYEFDQNPGITPPLHATSRFEFLDDPLMSRQLIDFADGSFVVLTFHVPGIHCSSCIWLLENLHKLDEGIAFSRVDFLEKSLLLRYSGEKTTLRKIVTLLSSLGYEPELNLGSIQKKTARSMDRSLYLKLGVAAFCFGNIMLFSLPEYFAGARADLFSRGLFGIINLLLSLPVALYSASIFYVSAIQGLKKRVINIDVPIALGIAVVFIRSCVEVMLCIGPGYFDSLTGLVFLLLIGRLFQNKTYESLNFERGYQSYFPLAAATRKNGSEKTVPIAKLRPGDRIVIRNNEIIPADSVVINGTARIDYSFVTGESHINMKKVGDLVHAGGKQAGATIELEIIKEVSESTLVQLWNNFGASEKVKSRLLTLSTTVGKHFTLAILIIASATACKWWLRDPSRILDSVTSILIIACPCALALAAPFAFGTTMRIFGNRGFYLKNDSVVESLAKVDTIVFDKTGTLTQTSASSIQFSGQPLGVEESIAVASLARSSTHPLSCSIAEFLRPAGVVHVADFAEVEGEGICGTVKGQFVRLGSAEFVGAASSAHGDGRSQTRVYLSIDARVLGWFQFETRYRAGVAEVLASLGSHRPLIVLSGDTKSEEERLRSIYPGFRALLFNQKPEDKLAYIRELQNSGHRVLMVGDGLNDAGALWQSDVAIAVTDKVSSFSPACDAILDSASFSHLDRMLGFVGTTLQVVYWSFAISILYNLVGLWFAVQGMLSPLVAAILMPLSSVSVVVFSTSLTRFLAQKRVIAPCQ